MGNKRFLWIIGPCDERKPCAGDKDVRKTIVDRFTYTPEVLYFHVWVLDASVSKLFYIENNL